MPITYRIDPKRNLVIVEAKGVLHAEDYIEARTRLADDSRLLPGMDQLLDFRNVEQHDMTIELYSRFIGLERVLQERFGAYRLAVVTRSDLHFGFTRMFMVEMGSGSSNVRVFREMEEAEKWLFGASE
jgi:hypothetical protein